MMQFPTVQQIDEIVTAFRRRTDSKSMGELMEEIGPLYDALASSSEMRSLLNALVMVCEEKSPREWVWDHASDLIGLGIEIGLRMASDNMSLSGKIN